MVELRGNVKKCLFHDVDVMVREGAEVLSCVFVRCRVESEGGTLVQYCHFCWHESSAIPTYPEHVVRN